MAGVTDSVALWRPWALLLLALAQMMAGSLEPTGTLRLGALRQDASLFRHAASGIRVALCPVPGPLCKADIVIPTECANNGGLPHCLEHLVFMGSQRFPNRGYLDKLANLCISQVPGHAPASLPDGVRERLVRAGVRFA